MVPADIESLWDDLQHRWPEDVIEPTLTRIASVLDLLGSPQRAFPIVHVTGTNGKSSTARMIASLFQAAGLRTGLFTSPHLMAPNERIVVDGQPIDDVTVLEMWRDIQPYVEIVDAQSIAAGGPALSFFESMTALAYATFADAPVDIAVIEVGMGGEWDATNVADGQVAVITPIDLDHQKYLGDTRRDIALEKAGIIKRDARAVIAKQDDEVAEVLADRCREMHVEVTWEGPDFSVARRTAAVGGQLLDLRVGKETFTDVFLPLFGAHQAMNAALALGAAQTVLNRMTPEVVEAGFAAVLSPGRLQVLRRNPTIIVDTAHNPHGLASTLDAVSEVFDPQALVVVFGALADKDVRAMIGLIAEHAQAMVLCPPASARAMLMEDLKPVAEGILGAERVFQAEDLAEAIDTAVTLAEQDHPYGGGAVLITGSIVLVGQAIASFGGSP